MCSPAAPSLSTFTSSAARRRPALPLELELEPASPYLLAALWRRGSGDADQRRSRNSAAAGRGCPGSRPRLAAGAGPGRAAGRAGRSRLGLPARPGRRGPRLRRPAPARRSRCERMRFALGVDDDLSEFYRRFRRDPLLGPLIRRRPYLRPHAAPLALGGARLGGRQAADRDRPRGPDPAPHRRPLGPARWASATRGLRDVPPAALIAGRAPAELESMGLSAGALDRPQRGRPGDRRRALSTDCSRRPIARLLAVPEIGPWTVQCLGLFGRGEADSLPAGDLMLPEAGRPARAPRPPRHGRGGRGVLRALSRPSAGWRRAHPVDCTGSSPRARRCARRLIGVRVQERAGRVPSRDPSICR